MAIQWITRCVFPLVLLLGVLITLTGHIIVNVHLIMCPAAPKGCGGVGLHSDRFLIYAQRLDILPQGNRNGSTAERTTGLHVCTQEGHTHPVLCLAKYFLWISFGRMLTLFHALVGRQMIGLARPIVFILHSHFS